MKKLISVFLALALCFSALVCANAVDGGKNLAFKDGKFKILCIADCQDVYPAHHEMFDFINLALETYKPDFVVLCGDNTVGDGSTKQEAITELVAPYVNSGTYFTMVFGNHDHQQNVDKKTLFDMYCRAGGEYFLGFNEDPEDSDRVGTHFLPVYSSDGSKIAYGLYMFDSGNYEIDENGNELGYQCVSESQIEWYRQKRDSLKEETGAYVPAISFQHIVPADVYDELYYQSPFDLGSVGSSYNGKYYTFIPKLQNFDGYLNEPPCPGYYNYGQVDAMAECGDMQALFVGHDHVNSYDVVCNGVHIINTPGITYHSYSDDLVQGCRLITIDEQTQSFSTEVITVNALAKSNAEYAEKIGLSQSLAAFLDVISYIIPKIGKAFAIFGIVLDALGAK